MIAELWKCEGNEYHADAPASVSHTELDCFLEDPALYHGRYVTGIYPRETTPALEFGQVFHAVLLGQPLDDLFVLIPGDVLTANGQRRGKAWDAFCDEHSGKVLLKPSEYEPIRMMAESIVAHPKARALLESEGDVEQAVRWTCQETGLRLRCRPDKMTTEAIVDLKSAADVSPKSFSVSAYNFGYHRQASLYSDGIAALTGERFPFAFIAVRKTPPYTCEVFELSPDFVDLGRKENRDGLRRMKHCIDTGAWRQPTHGTIVELGMPTWAKYESAWSMS